MPENYPTAPIPTVKPAKPCREFPLFPHATGRWAKKIKGRMHYFGPWSDPEAALKSYQAHSTGFRSGAYAGSASTHTPRPSLLARNSLTAAGINTLASHPAVDCPLATPNHLSDGGLIRGEAATIASPQVAPVDVTPRLTRRHELTSVFPTNVAYFSVKPFAILRLILARGSVSQS